MQQRSDRPSLYYVEGIQVKKTYQRQAPVDIYTTVQKQQSHCRGEKGRRYARSLISD